MKRLKRLPRRLLSTARLAGFKLRNRSKPRFECPICAYRGPFEDMGKGTPEVRLHARCPGCSSLERHRLQWLVFSDLRKRLDLRSMRAIHFAPEPFIRQRVEGLFYAYFTSDLVHTGVDLKADLLRLPFPTGVFDLVYASHVLEHVKDDSAALHEIRRILKEGGVAILPVPFYGIERTIEYPRPLEFGHLRAPGVDYYERYRRVFSSVELHTSDDFAERYQVRVYEDWSIFPTEKEPLRPPVPGRRHIDIVPVCQP